MKEKIPHSQPLKIRVATVGESNCVTTLTTSCKGENMLNSELLLVIREKNLTHIRSVQLLKGQETNSVKMETLGRLKQSPKSKAL